MGGWSPIFIYVVGSGVILEVDSWVKMTHSLKLFLYLKNVMHMWEEHFWLTDSPQADSE